MKKDPASSDTTPRQSRSNVVPLKGEIDLHVSPTVTAALNEMIDKKPERLVVDLSDVSYIDSAGLAALIQAMQKVEGYGGKFMLAGLQETVRSIFEISRLDQVFQIFPDADAAWLANLMTNLLRTRTLRRDAVRISSVCATFFEISNCDARSMLAERAASRREGSDQNRIASRKPTRFAGLSTIDPCTPSSMISLNPLERVVITGNPLASASRQALEKGS